MAIPITCTVEASALDDFLNVVASYSPAADELRQVRQALEREFAELGDNRLIYIAWDGETPMAVVQLLLRNADNDPELADGATVAHVHHLRVARNRRRQGVGRQLMRYVEEDARRMGYRRLTLGVDGENVGALAFYRSIGYEVLREEAGEFPGTVLYYMKRELGEPANVRPASPAA